MICVICFTLRASLLIYGTIHRTIDASPYFIGGYFFIVEILPSILVLFILRKLPSNTTKQPISILPLQTPLLTKIDDIEEE